MVIDQKAIEDLKWLAERMSGFIALGPVLEQLNSVDQAIQERTQTLADADAKLQSTLEQNTRLVQENIDLDEKVQNILDQAKADSAKLVQEGQAYKEASAEKVKRIFDQAQADADSLVAKAQSEVDSLSTRLADLQTQRSTEEQRLLQVQAVLAKLKADI